MGSTLCQTLIWFTDLLPCNQFKVKSHWDQSIFIQLYYIISFFKEIVSKIWVYNFRNYKFCQRAKLMTNRVLIKWVKLNSIVLEHTSFIFEFKSSSICFKSSWVRAKHKKTRVLFIYIFSYNSNKTSFKRLSCSTLYELYTK